MIGPRISPVETALERSAFAGCSCSAGTTSGSRPVDAGLKKPVAVPVTPASSASIHTSAEPAISRAAIAPWLATRTRSAITITARREARSATTPPSSTLPTRGNTPAASTSPTSEVEPPISSTANASATATIRSPRTDTACPLRRSRNSRTAQYAEAVGQAGHDGRD